MQRYGQGWRFFETPHGVTLLLIATNIAVYVLQLGGAGVQSIPTDRLLAAGAMYSGAIPRHEYWRLVAYGFLHVDLMHLATNLLCLLIWGSHLEKRIGSFYFAVIYAAALVAGALVSNATHAGPYVTVGASGGVSGVLGALCCLWILGKTDLKADFFIANIGLNVAITFLAPRVDWAAHLGGFTAGLVGCALLNLLEHGFYFVLRGKVPEFVKVNSALLLAALVYYLWRVGELAVFDGIDIWVSALILTAGGLAALKLVDWLLSVRKGLAIVVLAFAIGNAVAVLSLGPWLSALYAPLCASRSPPPSLRDALAAACANPAAVVYGLAAGAFVLTMLIYLRPFLKGAADVGFVSASLTAERQRFRGI